MILVSVMLAVFLGWPLVFGGNQKPGAIESVQAKPVAAVASASAQPQLLQAAVQTVAAATSGPVQAESCYKRYQREVKTCSGNGSAACRLKSADNWDLCEATGFWPQ
jgi:hypothetical protein